MIAGSRGNSGSRMTWFEKLTGFPEKSPAFVRENLRIDGNRLLSEVNGRTMIWGRLETPSLTELREQVRSLGCRRSKTTVREIVADVEELHKDRSNKNALFQVASQFNLLEMVSPHVTPEEGVGIYEHDRTQGPTCARAAGAGTIYRNYFVPVDGQIGQSATNQIDCLSDMGAALGNGPGRLWEMRNGYACATGEGLAEISHRLASFDESDIDDIRRRLRIGLQWETEVTAGDGGQTVSQAYCSALPVAYGCHPAGLWEPFARIVLEASYEAAICAGIMNFHATGNRTVYLTLVGGGVFGNPVDWIIKAMERAIGLYDDGGLDIAVVSFGGSKQPVCDLIGRLA